MFSITGSKGFQITFPNKVTVSVQFGPRNYCDNYNSPLWSIQPLERLDSNTAEVVIFHKGHKDWLTKEYLDEGDDVLGYQTPDDVLKILNWAANYKVKES
jgi:hypothetical protein